MQTENKQLKVKLKIYLPALGYAFCLQRKRWYGWKTVAWGYPSQFENMPYSDVLNFLIWEERYLLKSEKTIGKAILKSKK